MRVSGYTCIDCNILIIGESDERFKQVCFIGNEMVK